MGETIRGYDIVVVKRKSSIRPIVDAFTVVYDSVQRIDENGSSDLGTLSSAKASILVNGSPFKEFSCHRGLKQGDPLAPYLFILVMESLHLFFSRAVDEGLFKDYSRIRYFRRQMEKFDSPKVVAFSVIYDNVQQMDENGSSDLVLFQNALTEFQTGYGHPFTMEACWRILKNHAAWIEIEVATY
nr:putative RNA-directed DNA polymerase, eukaryota, reverse transcriptase zinc-binding domain protein [Tanacetum cinerariifolium]